jgi:hypothetical protein
MFTRVAMPLLTILMLPVLALALSVLFVVAWIEETSRLRALRQVHGDRSEKPGFRG